MFVNDPTIYFISSLQDKIFELLLRVCAAWIGKNIKDSIKEATIKEETAIGISFIN